MLSQFSMSDFWLQTQLDTARYAHVPLGNLPADYPVAVLDLFFARALHKENHLLWVSPSSRPDLGGLEDDDARLMAELDGDSTMHVNVSGVYKTVCIELDITKCGCRFQYVFFFQSKSNKNFVRQSGSEHDCAVGAHQRH